MPKYEIIIPSTIKPPPSEHEVSAVAILTGYFKSSIQFINPSQSYKHKSPDILVNNVTWEIKSPKSSSKKSTIKNTVKRASKQSSNIVIDARRTKLDETTIINQLLIEAKYRKSVSKIVLISKTGTVIEVFKRR